MSLFQLVTVVLFYNEMFAAVHIDLRLEESLYFYVVESWSSAVPVSYQGIGVREAAFDRLGNRLSRAKEPVVVVAATLSVSTIVVRLFGAFLRLAPRNTRNSPLRTAS